MRKSHTGRPERHRCDDGNDSSSTQSARSIYGSALRTILSRKPAAIMRPLDSSDPRSLDHPCHEEQWLELARSIGRSLARQEWDRLQGKEGESK